MASNIYLLPSQQFTAGGPLPDGHSVVMPQFLPFQEAARVSKVMVKAGDEVKKGDTLCVVDTINDNVAQSVLAPEDGKINSIAGANSTINVGRPVADMEVYKGANLIGKAVRDQTAKGIPNFGY